MTSSSIKSFFKNIAFLMFFICTTAHVNAQKILDLIQEDDVDFYAVQKEAKEYFAIAGTGKGTGYKLYKRWEYWALRKLDNEGRVLTDKRIREVQKRTAQRPTKTAARPLANWTELGPKGWVRSSSWSPGLGRIVRIAVEPTDQNLIFAGSPGGGIWRSINAGQDWTPVGDNLLNMNIWAIGIDPLNNNIIYHGNSSGELLKSTNQGDSWIEVGSGISGTPKEILIHPKQTNRIWIATSRGIYYSTNSGNSFSQISTVDTEDLDFKPGDLNTVYGCGDDFQRSTDGGLSFTTITNGINISERMKMAVSPANPAIVYLVQKSNSNFGRIYKSTNSGVSFSIVVDNTTITDDEINFSQANRDMAIAVSPIDANEIHVGGIDYSRSLDGGYTWTKMARWSDPENASYIHADVEVLEYFDGKLYAGTDGGLFVSSNRGDNMIDLTKNGLAVRQYYRFGNAATDENMIVGGAQDNGTNIMKSKNGEFIEWLGADGMECFIDYTDPKIIYGTSQNGSLYKSTNGGATRFSLTSPTEEDGNWVTPFEIDPINHNWVYVGYADIFRSKSGGENNTWENLSSSVDFNGNIDELKISPSNNNYIYVANNSNMWITKNGLTTSPSWTEISNFQGNVNYISIDPNNELNVVIATTGEHVYKTTNAGNTWTEITGDLPSVGVQCVLWDDGLKNGIYAGLNRGIYYINDTSSTWSAYSDGIPNAEITELEIHYASRTLRASTYGRGIWESDLFGEGISSTITTTKTSACYGEAITLTASTPSEPGNYTFQWYINDEAIPNSNTTTYEARTSGDYTVVTSNGATSGQSNTITLNIIASTPPSVANINNCGGGEIILNATQNESEGVLNWYNDDQKTNLVGTGQTLEVTHSSNTSYFVEEVVALNYKGGAPNNTIGDGLYYNGKQNLLLDVYQPFTLKKVTVYAKGAGNRTLRLLDENDNTLNSQTIAMTDGENRLTLDFNIPLGTNLKIGFDSDANLYRNSNGTAYPYTTTGIFSITTSTGGIDYYYYLYDWEIETTNTPAACTSDLSELLITIIDNVAPETIDGVVCKAGEQVNLIANGNGGDLIWYDAETEGNKLHEGGNYTVNVNSTQSYFVEEISGIERFNVGPTNNRFGTGGSHAGGYYIVFNAEKPFILESATVYASGSKERTLELFDANGNIIESRVINIEDGEQSIDLDLNIPAGNNMKIGFATGADLYRNNNGVSFPYEVPNLVTLTSSSAAAPQSGDFFYYLYNWKIADVSNACISPRTETTAELSICTGSQEDYFAEVGVYPNPTEGVVFLNLPQNENIEKLQVINTKGTTVFETNEVTKNINLKGLKSGLYFIIINTEDNRLVKRITLK